MNSSFSEARCAGLNDIRRGRLDALAFSDKSRKLSASCSEARLRLFTSVAVIARL